MLKIAVTGATGRMGKEVIQAINAETDSILTEVIVRSDHDLLGKRVNDFIKLNNSVYSLVFTDMLSSDNLADVLIDFSLPIATKKYLVQCLQLKRPMVIGTTGLSDAYKKDLQHAAEQIPIVLAPNMSLGVNICYKLLEICAKTLNADWQVAISEIHHKNKKDAPSGTALKMGEIIAMHECLDKNTVQYNSIRAGDVVGEHSVLFVGDGEQIEITHRATDRKAFAKGALTAAKWIIGKKPGLYTMQDVINKR
jgi:4-hydroxy-tetrahydrodipicolinate reductase